MGNKHLAIVNVVLSLSALLNVVALNDLGYCVEKYGASPGDYWKSKGVAAVLYNIAQRTVVYVN
jgi:hypothetical protein